MNSTYASSRARTGAVMAILGDAAAEAAGWHRRTTRGRAPWQRYWVLLARAGVVQSRAGTWAAGLEYRWDGGARRGWCWLRISAAGQ